MNEAVYINTRADVKRYLLHIANDHGFIAGVLADGTLEYGPNYTPDGAAKAFWEAMAYHSPVLSSPTGHTGPSRPEEVKE